MNRRDFLKISGLGILGGIAALLTHSKSKPEPEVETETEEPVSEYARGVYTNDVLWTGEVNGGKLYVALFRATETLNGNTYPIGEFNLRYSVE